MSNNCENKVLTKKILLLCEGDTEQHYYNGLRQNKTLKVTIKPINVGGGGYKEMLKAIKENSGFGYFARIVVLDLDRYHTITTEKAEFTNIIQYVGSQNRRQLPVLLIASNPDFDEFVLLHDATYNGNRSMLNSMGYKSIDELKADEFVYQKFNNGKNRDVSNALTKFNTNRPLFNDFKLTNKATTLINSLIVNGACFHIKTSNIEDFYRLLEKLG